MFRFFKGVMWSAVLGVMLLPGANAQQAQGAPPSGPGQRSTIDLGLRFELEPKAIDILKASSAKLAAAKTLALTAIATYESPARTGQPLAYMTRSEVTLERPNKLRVL